MLYTFSEDVKGELCHTSVNSELEAKSELAGFLKSRGVIIRSFNDVVVKIEVGFIPAARRIMNLMAIVGTDKKRLTMIKNKLKKKRVQIFIPFSILSKLELDILEIPAYIFEDLGLFGAFLRGVFISTGSVTDPTKNYHFEIISHNYKFLNEIQKYLFDNLGILGKIASFGEKNYRFYLKRAKDIIEILYYMGAQRNADKMEKIVSSREIKSDFNRSMNFLTANAKRVGESNARQIRIIKNLFEKYGEDILNGELKKIALLRLENEDLSLSDLGKLFDPPLSKSMVYNRIKKIFKIYEELESKNME
ncbi:DNA-binding protein WhiA [Thermosipho globiformans]|uniref:DNA-binding protein WhiA n=1 Tax=Thermosipho globiformans TaxID=380685 RepID=UPI000F8C51B6|nr:DNA-binding protein WhiA [Thermosipho globiformans]